jgi:hypothetical protein
MKKLISVSTIFFCFVLISPQSTGQAKTQVTPQKKVQPKTQVTPQKKAPAKTQVTPQKKVQTKTQAAPKNKGQIIKETTPCVWQKNEVDPFTGSSVKTTNWEVVGFISSVNNAVNNGLIGDYKFSISQNIQNKDTTWTLWIKTSTSQSLSFNKESKIMIKSGEKILTINLFGATVSGRNITSNGILDKDARKFLKKHPIDLLRIQLTGDGNAIVNVDLKNVDTYAKMESDYFIKTLRCFE